MRLALRELCGHQVHLNALYVGEGKIENTVLLRNVCLHGKLVADHIWIRNINIAKVFGNAQRRDVIAFDATVQMYARKSTVRPDRIFIAAPDYGLVDIKNVSIIKPRNTHFRK